MRRSSEQLPQNKHRSNPVAFKTIDDGELFSYFCVRK
jgi:hypothetical protein